VVVAIATRILFTRDMAQRAFGYLALDYSEGSRRVGKVHGTDLGEITKIARVKGHRSLDLEVGEL
jgi:hypothetical protein